MTKNKSECIDTARQLLNLFTSDELEHYIKEVITRTKNLQDSGVPFARNAAMKEINNEQLAYLLEDSARIARDIGKWDIIKAGLDKGYRKKSYIDKTRENTDYNIETAGHAEIQGLNEESFQKLSKEQLNTMEEAKLDDAIYAIADGIISDNASIKAIGEALRDYIPIRNARLVQADAMRASELNHDRFFRNTYNPSKMVKMTKPVWVALHKSLIDIKGTFENTRAMDFEGNINDAIVDEMIGNTFDNIIQGNGALFTKASVSKDSDRIERTRHMFYKYKDWKSWGIANKEYGQGTLIQAWLMDIQGSGRQIGMAKIMGTQPQKMYLKMREVEVAKDSAAIYHTTVKGRAKAALKSVEYATTDALFNNLLGANKGAYNYTVADTFASIRSLTTMARLGKLAVTSIPDISQVAGIVMRSGNGYWRPMFSAIIHAFDVIPSEDRKVVARFMSSALDHHAGAITRYMDPNDMGKIISKMSNLFFLRTLVNAWDRGNKKSAMVPIMLGFGKGSKKSMSGLNHQQQAYLRRFNISEVEWDALRAKTVKNRFTTDNVTDMSPAEIRELWNKTDKIIPLSEYQSTLYRKVFAMFDTAHEFAVLNPKGFTNLMRTWNTQAGHPQGEAVRLLMQFKGYPIDWFRRVVMGGLQDFDSNQAKLMYALNMMVGIVMLTQLSDILKAISSGLTPPDPSKMSASQQRKYYGKMLLGGAGVFNTILNDPNATKPFFFTPGVRFLYDPAWAAWSLATGDVKKAKLAAKDWANVANPIATLYGVSPLIDAIYGNKPYLEPGQHSLF